MGSVKGVGGALAVLGIILMILSFVPIQEKIYENTFEVAPGLDHTFCVTFKRDVDLTIEVRVLQGIVSFWVLPESELRVYEIGGNFRFYTNPSRPVITDMALISWSPPVGEGICFVYDGRHFAEVYTKITATSRGSAAEVFWPGFVLFLVGALIAVGSGGKKGGSSQATSSNQ